MDTRAPPIAPRSLDRCQQQQQQQHQQQHQHHNQHPEEVTLPPLKNFPAQRQRAKFGSAPGWRNGGPGLLGSQEAQRRRPYRVLELGATPLMHACQQADRGRVLRLLREQEATIGYRDRALRSALHYCMDAGTGGAVAQAAPELVDSPDAEGRTALHLAVIAGDAQLVAVLLASGADVDAKDAEGHGALHWATVCGEVECVRLLLAAGARPSAADLRGGSPLHYAAQCCGAVATAELAVPKRLGLKVLQTLLEFGADVNARDEDGRQPILWAASAGSVEAVLALVRAGGSAVASASDKDGLTALHCAASRGHARCVEALVNLCDAQPDHVDDNGCSALHYAATLGHADATSLLLKLGADPNRQDRKGRTPALCAAAKGQLETLKILAQHGGSLHARTVRGTGVGHEAVASGRLELVKWLSKRRPSLLDVATQDGKTPLHVAALHGHLDACKLLLDSGARINALMRTSKSTPMTALDAALYRGHRDCAKLIQLHGGTTAQHLKHKSGQPKVFSTKLRIKRAETSSDSELNDASPSGRRHRHRTRNPELYYEERWIERRTRRRATNRRRLSREDSRSYSEEELRRTKSTSQTRANERQRRALSENARYEGGDAVEHDGDIALEPGGRRRRSERHSKRKKEENDPTSGSETEGTSKSPKSDEESSTVTDDSLEVVVVKRSLEKKSEKIISGKKSKTPRDTSKDSKDTSKTNEINVKKSSMKKQDKQKDEKSKTKKNKPETFDRKSSSQDQEVFDGDSTSQGTVEQVITTADVHKNEAPNSSRDKTSEVDAEQDLESQTKSKMDDILQKADELQNALMSKAADLRKDMEEMRQQASHKTEIDQKNIENVKVTTLSKSEVENSIENTSNELSSNKENSPKSLDETLKTVDEKSGVEVLDKAEKYDKNTEEANITKTDIKPEKTVDVAQVKDYKEDTQNGKKESSSKETVDSKKDLPLKEEKVSKMKKESETKKIESTSLRNEDNRTAEAQEQTSDAQTELKIPGSENFRYADESSSSSPQPKKVQSTVRRPTTGNRKGKSSGAEASLLFESSEEPSPDRSAIVAVIESPEWDEEDDDELDKEIRQVIGEEDPIEEDDDEDESDGLGGADDDIGIVRVLPSTSEEETGTRTSAVDSLPQLQAKPHTRKDPGPGSHLRQRRDSGGRDSGIEPSPRVSRIPRRTIKCYPNSERQHALHMETITRDVQINLRRYHLERKIFFQLMELKRLQIRHGRTNEQVLVKRQVEAFHKAGMSGPALGVARYDQPFTFRHFETFLYEQLRRLQRRPATPDWCIEAKQCTQKTHRCHHVTSAYTSVPIYTYLGGSVPERPILLPRIEGRGKGQMTVEVTHGEEKQVIALPSENPNRAKRYYVTFTVRGDVTDGEKTKTPSNSATPRNTKSV